MKKMVRGELTAFLSLIFLLLLSFVGVVLESASIQVMKNEYRADASRAMESGFAEYQRSLFQEYHIFAIEGTYETGTYSETNILNRLSYYGTENMDQNIEKLRYLTDQGGRAFYEQAVQYEKEKTAVDKIEGVIGVSSNWDSYMEQYKVYEEDQKKTSNKLEQLLQESESQLLEEDNPLQTIAGLKKKSIWSVLLPEDFQVSEKKVTSSELVSKRELQVGNWEESEETTGAIFFNLYLMEHFGSAIKKEKDRMLDYELEYLYAGKNTDKENLEIVLKNICNLRFGINYLYLLSDSEKQAEARAMAAGLCTLLTVPGVSEVAAQAILLAWAYGESLLDVKTLISGGKVSLVKTKSNWNLSLDKLIKLGEDGNIQKRENDEGGLDYETYLQIMVYLKNKSMLSMRALDLIEQNLKQSYSYFQADHCITGLKIQTECNLRRGITYKFSTQYQYQ